ncbi:protein takeout-like [Ischnura elegans]|uniref:protein takeout-like n=1 Tax=Ischnura elegans TaxID=197161 RepID=UPI001ED8B636|nr:protein takeout-like [Ischnura elegans]
MISLSRYYIAVAIVSCGFASAASIEKQNLDDLQKDNGVHDRETLDEYLYELIEGLRDRMHTGVPELEIPCMEPLKISSIVINQGGGVAKIKAAFKNLEVYGLSNYTTTYARSDPQNYRFTLGLKFRELKIYGDYDVSGNLLMIPISGQGRFWSLLNGVTADSYNTVEIINKVLRLKKTQTDFDIGRMRVRLDNLFDGDKLLGDTVNGVLNEQSQELIREIKPRFSKEIDAIILKVFGGALSTFPVEKWQMAITDDSSTAEEIEENKLNVPTKKT